MNRTRFVFLLPLVLAGCGDKYDRMTSSMMMESFRAKGALPLNTVTAPAVELYYIQRYGANALQKKTAEETAQRYLIQHGQSVTAPGAGTLHRAATRKTTASRYVAVDVPRVAASQGAASVMVFDTQARQIVGNNVYDLENRPKIKQPLKFDTYSVEYIGNGSSAE